MHVCKAKASGSTKRPPNCTHHFHQFSSQKSKKDQGKSLRGILTLSEVISSNYLCFGQIQLGFDTICMWSFLGDKLAMQPNIIMPFGDFFQEALQYSSTYSTCLLCLSPDLTRFKGWPDGHSFICSSHRFGNNFTGEWARHALTTPFLGNEQTAG